MRLFCLWYNIIMLTIKMTIPPGLFKMDDNMKKRLSSVVMAVASNVKASIAPYAPSTAANVARSDGRAWYQRGYGPKRMRRDGTVWSKKSSQTMGRRWTIKKVNDGLGAIIGNNATYSPYVHSEELQAGFHGERGWKTDQQAIDENRAEGETMLKQQIDAELEIIAHG